MGTLEIWLGRVGSNNLGNGCLGWRYWGRLGLKCLDCGLKCLDGGYKLGQQMLLLLTEALLTVQLFLLLGQLVLLIFDNLKEAIVLGNLFSITTLACNITTLTAFLRFLCS
jgi:hypothetical protein